MRLLLQEVGSASPGVSNRFLSEVATNALFADFNR